jgi:photosystem II stability/assembly factor-like uncharacterized protein
MRQLLFFLVLSFTFVFYNVMGQNTLTPDSALVNDIGLRGIGPAMASGRIADFAMNPHNPFEYYVAVASGHIWKTTNNGTTWQPVFENYGAYAIGCLAMDPNNSHVVWTGTGENNSQRALGYGNGVYKTIDGGKTWKNMGLETSRQVGKILIDPRNSNVVYVAAEGSVWGPGGDRGVFKTSNGGESWKKVLEISENTGAYDLEFHPENPDIIYTSVHQRRRRSFSKINGGPESAVYKSADGGDTWRKIIAGLPDVHLGRVGLSVTPAAPSLVYAIVEAADGKGGFYRSSNEGESWERMSDYTSSGQYYTTIYADPKDADIVYSMDTYSRVSKNGGKSWEKISTEKRHVDDHALWINPDATNHLIIGGDGGIYESYDAGGTWKFIGNLPVTQFYRVNVDNSEPYYYVYGGTQDNNTLGGPSQNTTTSGVSNDDWFVTIGGDGFWIAIDPENPDIVYSEYQYGNAYRYNRSNGEVVYIRPQERKGELTYKWNWDTPMILSHHSNTRLYMAANKLFKSENKGDSWEVISEDLTAQKDRNDFKVMGKYWSSDAVAKDVSTSQYGTIVSLAESRLKEGLLFTGSDDGVIQVTENNGINWTKFSSFPGVPAHTYVSDIFADRFDENIVYATFNNHKSNDFKPYVLMSEDKGKSWTSIRSNLPEGAVYSICQDFKEPNMLFCGTEFGLFVTFNKGKSWIEIEKGMPDVAVRDMVIQERENDLVLATFGRGFYILHNYDALRHISNISNDTDAHIFPIKDAKLYVPEYRRKSSFGDNYYMVENLPFGAEITYYLKENLKTEKEKRQEKEAELFKEGAKIDVNSWEDDRQEKLEEKPYLLLVIKDSKDRTIRKLTAKPKKGINRVYWDLRYAHMFPVASEIVDFDPFKEEEYPQGVFVMPGEYSVELYASEKGMLNNIADKVTFHVKALSNNGFNDVNREATLAFQNEVADLSFEIRKAHQDLEDYARQVQLLKQQNLAKQAFTPEMNTELVLLERKIADAHLQITGHAAKASREEIPPSQVPLNQRMSFLTRSFLRSSEGVNDAQRQSLEIVESEFSDLKNTLEEIRNALDQLMMLKE